MGLHAMTGVSQEERNRERETQRKRPHEDRGRGRSDAATRQGMPGAIRNWERPERTLLWSLVRSLALLTLLFQTSGLQKHDKINFCCFKPLNVWYFVMATPGNKYMP